MNLEQTLDAQLRQAMRDKDKAKVACIRQVRAKLQDACNQPNFRGSVDDALVQRTIAAYVKSLEKSCQELAAGGARGETLVAQYREEVAYLRQFLPQLLSETQVRALVDEALAAGNINDPKQAGKVLGALMKAHPGKLDVQRTKAIVGARLAARAEGTP